VVSKSAVEHLFWAAITLRDHLWHQRDLGETLGTIRYMKPEEALPPHGAVRSSWSKKTADVFPTGPGCVLNIRSSLEQQVDWLQRIDPAYLLTYPSIVAALADFCAERSIKLPSLREVRTFGEVLEPQTRIRCREALGVGVVDLYSSEEVGYIGLQCPETDHYHVQSESVLVEILDEQGQPCQPGETGRVVVSSLHNFASPLIRYEIGDYAEVGPPCPCGRGLPTLGRILGRKRNLLTLPNGEQRWPSFSESDRPLELPPFQQFQLVQTRPDQIKIRVVRPAPFSEEEQRVVEDHLSRNLGYAFAYSYEYVDSIGRSPTGKFEEFRSEIAVASDRH
jgi:phenylacetate-CoA ligase